MARSYSTPGVLLTTVLAVGLVFCALGRSDRVESITVTMPPSTVETTTALPKAAIIPHQVISGYPLPESCTFNAPQDPEERHGQLGYWLDGEGMMAVSRIGVFFEGYNRLTWYLKHPGPLDIVAKRLSMPASSTSVEQDGADDSHSVILVFRRSGCWQIQANSGNQKLSATVFVYPIRCRPDFMGGPNQSTNPQPCAPSILAPAIAEESQPQIVSDIDELPIGCYTPQEAAQLIVGFLQSFNQGDQSILAQYIPVKSSEFLTTGALTTDTTVFQAYTVTDPSGNVFRTDNRDDVLAYFAKRHAQDEFLQLLRLTLHVEGGLVHFEFLIDRQAKDIPDHIAIGKGAIKCKQQQIIIWAMSRCSSCDQIADLRSR